MNIGAEPGEFKIKCLVRDKDGNPKLDSKEMALKFWDTLSDEDKAFLTEKFNLKMEK